MAKPSATMREAWVDPRAVFSHNWGSCGQCGARIVLSLEVSERRQAEVYRRTRPLFTTSPIYGTERHIPLPPYPCGHVYLYVQRCFRSTDGRFKYDA